MYFFTHSNDYLDFAYQAPTVRVDGDLKHAVLDDVVQRLSAVEATLGRSLTNSSTGNSSLPASSGGQESGVLLLDTGLEHISADGVVDASVTMGTTTVIEVRWKSDSGCCHTKSSLFILATDTNTLTPSFSHTG